FLCDDNRITGTIAVFTSETVTAVHIHGPAGRGDNGPVLFVLPLPVDNHIALDLGSVTPEQKELLTMEHTYVDVHSLEHPGGVLRGQIQHEIAVTPIGWARVKCLYRD